MEEQAISIIKIPNEFFKRANKLTRCIIEGGYQDNWKRHTVDREVFELNEKTDRIIIADYNLDLIAFLNKDKIIAPYEKKAEFPLKVEYNYFLRIQRPCTIITEDGRIYHDKELFEQRRIESFIKLFSEKYEGKNFLEIYEALRKKK